jgi:hypothetical protein
MPCALIWYITLQRHSGAYKVLRNYAIQSVNIVICKEFVRTSVREL